MAELRRIYWDSGCYIAILKDEQPWASDLRQTTREAEDGRVQIVASTMVLSEVVRPKGSEEPFDRATMEPLIRGVFDNDYLLVVSHTRYIAERGRELVWDLGLHPHDAIHVATALHARCSVLETLDTEILRLDGRPELKGMKVRKPTFEGQRLIDPPPA